MADQLDADELATYSSFTVDPNVRERRPEARTRCGTVGIAGLASVDTAALKAALQTRALRDRVARLNLDASSDGARTGGRSNPATGASATLAGMGVNGVALGSTSAPGGVAVGGLAAPKSKAAAPAGAGLFGAATTTESAVDVETWYRYPLWETLDARDACAHPRQDASDYQVSYLHVRLRADASLASDVETLDAEHPEWRGGLWGLVGLKDDSKPDKTLASNLADASIEPLWSEWDADAMGYEPHVYASPRAAMMLRVLKLVEDFQEGIPETFEGYDVKANVLDVILAGGMQYELYGFEEDPTVAAFFAPLDSALASITQALADLDDAFDALGVALAELYLTYLAQVTVFNDLVGNLIFDVQAELLGTTDDPDIDRMMAQVGLVIAEVSLLTAALGPIIGLVASLAPHLFLAAAITAIAALAAIKTALDLLNAALPGLKASFSDANAELYIVEHYVRPTRVTGATSQTFARGPEIDTVLWGPGLRTEYDMTTVEFPVTFEGHFGSISSAANHGFLPSEDDTDLPFGSRVWFGAPRVEWCAVAYDWFVWMAIRHYAASFRESGVDAENQRTAAGLCLRMALSACAYYSAYVLHESAHNLNLWHCRAPDSEVWGFAERNRAAGCVQDAIGVLFRAYLTARLGLPVAGWSGPPDQTDEGRFLVEWKLREDGGARCSTNSRVVHAGGGFAVTTLTDFCCATVTTPVQPFNEKIECLALESGAAGLGSLADVVLAGAVAVIIWDALDPSINFANSGSSAAAQLAELFGELREDETVLAGLVAETDDEYFFATMTYNIDRPMNLNANVSWGCFVGRSVCSDTVGPIALWTTNVPTGYQGCSCSGDTLEASC